MPINTEHRDYIAEKLLENKIDDSKSTCYKNVYGIATVFVKRYKFDIIKEVVDNFPEHVKTVSHAMNFVFYKLREERKNGKYIKKGKTKKVNLKKILDI